MSGPFPIWADIVARSEPPLIALAGGGQTMLALRIFPTRQSVQSWVRAIQQRGWLQEESALGKRDWKSSIPTHAGRMLIRIRRFTIWRICLTYAVPSASPK